jgi:hypothetical protein
MYFAVLQVESSGSCGSSGNMLSLESINMTYTYSDALQLKICRKTLVVST